jgi:hypothetical protein
MWEATAVLEYLSEASSVADTPHNRSPIASSRKPQLAGRLGWPDLAGLSVGIAPSAASFPPPLSHGDLPRKKNLCDLVPNVTPFFMTFARCLDRRTEFPREIMPFLM